MVTEVTNKWAIKVHNSLYAAFRIGAKSPTDPWSAMVMDFSLTGCIKEATQFDTRKQADLMLAFAREVVGNCSGLKVVELKPMIPVIEWREVPDEEYKIPG
jgi:hypothetical protein